MGEAVPLVITGAGGRLGRLLRCLWPEELDRRLAPVWFARKPAIPEVLGWNMAVDAAPDLPRGAVILHLAGSVSDLAEYRASTLAICAAARQSGARHLFIASSGAVYRPQAQDNREDTPPDPSNAYGLAKLAAEQAAMYEMATGLTLLRIGNIAGADALLGGNTPGRHVVLDPVAGQNGPERSYIGPTCLAAVFSRLAALAVEAAALPLILNVAQPGRIAMGDLLDAAGRDWGFGPPNAGVLPRLTLNCERLAALLSLPAATAKGLVADLATLAGALAMTPAKRLADILLALILIILLALPFTLLLLWLLIRQGRPLFYVAERMRTPDRGFMLWKLRTMSPAKPGHGGVSGGDKAGRISPIGLRLRRTRLDEIPQLWNVLKGDMSFVGPRPPLRAYVERFPDLYAQVLQSRPGITGLATLHFHRHEEWLLTACKTAEETDSTYARRCIPRKARLDLIYQRNRSLCMDAALMAATLKQVLPRI